MFKPTDPRILPKVLIEYVAMAAVYDAVRQTLPGGVADVRNYIDQLDPAALNDPTRRMAVLVADLKKQKLLKNFIHKLALLNPGEPVLQELLADRVAVDSQGRAPETALQSIRNDLEAFVDMELLENLARTSKRRVCAIAVNGTIQGTGFLVGADLVITARHVVQALIVTEPVAGDSELVGSDRSLACIFDYFGMSYQPFPLNPAPPGIVVAEVPERWLEWSSDQHFNDGLGHHFKAPPDIRNLFDCALIRLKQPVGRTALDSTGSNMRGWIDLSTVGGPLVTGQLMGLAQFPRGYSVKWSQGNYKQSAPGATRIWYSSATKDGSSGAPCFDSQGKVVAFHNAGYPKRPGRNCTTRKFNQGVPLAPVIAALPQTLQDEVTGKKPPPPAFWSLGDDSRDAAGNPHPVLGRTRLQKLIAAAVEPAAAKRVIVVEETAGDASVGKSGKTFSMRILRAMMTNRPGMVVALEAKKLRQAEPLVFLTELAKHTGVFDPALPAPPCPDEVRQRTRWWSNDLPNWYGQLVEAAARRDGTMLSSPDPQTGLDVERIIAPIWIAIDDIHRHPLGDAMRECIAGLIGITESTSRLSPGLLSLRWLLIGAVPDFVLEQTLQFELETIEQSNIGKDACLACCAAALQCEGLGEKFDKSLADQLIQFRLASEQALKQAFAMTLPDSAYLPVLAEGVRVAIPDLIEFAKNR